MDNLRETTILKPFTRFLVTIGELPSSYLQSMSYYEQLDWFCEYLEKSVIPAINNNGEATKEVQTKFIELRQYVNDYFSDLNLQSQINTKLDEMAESGELAEIINVNIFNELNAKVDNLQDEFDDSVLLAVKKFDTVTEMKQAELEVDDVVLTLGYHSLNDLGGATYKIRLIEDDEETDEIFKILLNDSNIIAELIVDKKLYISQAGIDNNITNNTTRMATVLSYLNDHNNIELIIDKDFSINNIDFTGVEHVSISGNNQLSMITIEGVEGIGVNIPTNLNTFNNVGFYTNNDITILKITGKYNNFINCKIHGSNQQIATGIDIDKWCNIFNMCSIRELKNCIKLHDTANHTIFNNCIIIGCDNAIDGSCVEITGGDNIVFSNCDIEKSYYNVLVSGGLVNFTGNYFEAASAGDAIHLLDGVTNFVANFFSNSKIAKYTNNKLTISHNICKKVREDYVLLCREANIGYLVVENNMMVDNVGYFTNCTYPKRPDSVVRYYDTAWRNGTLNDYCYINQDNCYTIEPSGRHHVYINTTDDLLGGTTAQLDNINTEIMGQTYGHRDYKKLLFWHNADKKWYDSLGNTPQNKLSSVPTGSGITYKVGDIVWNSTPQAGGYIGWVCITAGAPGTWKGFGSISS